MAYFLQNLVNALVSGSTYALIALGYTMVYGVLRLINFAHGDVFMIGAFVGAFVGINLAGPGNDQSYMQALAGIYCAVCVCGCAGYLIERLAYRPLRRSPKLSSLITAIGVSLLIEYLGQISWPAAAIDWLITAAVAVASTYLAYKGIALGADVVRRRPGALAMKARAGVLAVLGLAAIGLSAAHLSHASGLPMERFFGPTPQQYPKIAGSGERYAFMERTNVSLVPKDVLVLSVTAATLAGLWVLVRHTRMGKAMRAVSQNYDAARLMGIDLNYVISFTFVLGSSLAAIGGCLSGLYQNQCTPLMGLIPGLKAFVAAVIGGIGNIPGAAVGGLILGIVETFVGSLQVHQTAVLAPYKDGIAFFILIVVLLVKPEGIFAKALPEKV